MTAAPASPRHATPRSPTPHPPTPRNPTTRPRLRAVVLLGLAVVGFTIAALALAAYFQSSLGLQVTLLAILFAALPLLIVIPTFVWLDRFEAEPTRLLVFAFLWGALVSALGAAVLNTGAIIAFQTATDPDAALAVTAVVVAPLVEEALKGALVLLVWLLHRREFDGITDGMVYAGIVAAGFAFTENIQYLGQAYAEGGGAFLAGTFVLRGIMSPFAHPMFTVLTGIGIGIAATTTRRWVMVVAPLVGFLLAALAHSLWNLAAVAGGTGMLVVYLLVEVPIFFVFLSLVLSARVTQMANIVVAVLYAVTIAGGTIGESYSYYILGSFIEAALLAGVIYCAWTWPRTTDAVADPADQSRTGTHVHT